MIIDIIAASEGSMGMSIATVDTPAETGRFQPLPGVIVITEDGRPIEPGSGQPGLVALPGGADEYYKDAAKSAGTFRVIDGRHYTVPGDLAIPEADGSLTLLGRGSSVINTAGEKVYPEEVEEVLKALPSVEDALVFGVADERFGQRVAAVLSRTEGTDEPVDSILAAARERLASYKLPRAVVVVDEVPRTQVGKPDYPTAKALFEARQ
jgi:fatty-acyl-CoA synthase